MTAIPTQLDLFDGRRKARNPIVWPTEHEDQCALIAWAAWEERRRPELRLLHAIPNGGERYAAVAVGLQAEGVKPGVPDLDLPVPRGNFCGLRIEMKRQGRKPKPTSEQSQWLADLAAVGHSCHVCQGWEAARAVILAYLALDAGRGSLPPADTR
jgi:hypothetical protein